nr:hypothetical protein [Chimaeribacter californicus]
MVKSAVLRSGINNLFDKEYLTSARITVFNAAAYNGVMPLRRITTLARSAPSVSCWKPPADEEPSDECHPVTRHYFLREVRRPSGLADECY